MTPEAMTAPSPAPPNVPESMIGMEILTELIETAIYSSQIMGAIPVSVFIVGPSGAGKSKIIMQYRELHGCMVTTDVTSMGLQELMAGDKENKIKFLIIPDFNLVLSHRSSTLQLTIANLLSMMSEGTVRIDDGRKEKEVKHRPVGVITAMTRDMYSMVAKKWVALGLTRRFLPVYYNYKIETREKIQTSISSGSTTLMQLALPSIIMPREPEHININPVASRIEILSHELASNMGYVPSLSKKTENNKDEKGVLSRRGVINIGKQLEFSPHLGLRTLAKAHALRGNRDQVDDSDVQFLMKILEFTRYDEPGKI